MARQAPSPSSMHFFSLFSSLLSMLIGGGIVLALERVISGWMLGIWLASGLLSLVPGQPWQAQSHDAYRRFVVLLLLGVTVILYWGRDWLSLLAQILVLLLAAKQLELRQQRDAFQIAALALLGLGIAAFLRVDLGLAALLGGVLIGTLMLLLWQPLVDAACKQPPFKPERRWGLYAGVLGTGIALTLLPVALLVFFLLPRSQLPLWQWSPPQAAGMVGFSPDMSLGGLGRLATNEEIAFRARVDPRSRSDADLYWVGAVLWENQGERWLPKPPESGDGMLPGLRPGVPVIRQKILLAPTKTPYLFALAQPRQLSGLDDVRFRPDGTLRLPQVPASPLRYEVLSQPGDAEDLSPRAAAAGRQLPAGMDPRLAALAHAFHHSGDTPERMTSRLVNWLSGRDFHYSLEMPPGYEHGQSLSQFLFDTHTGYCEYYAAALTTLLRLNDIPARVVVGFRGGEYNPLGDYWVVRQKTAHAWTEAWFPGRGWLLLDATPGSPVNPFAPRPATVSKSPVSTLPEAEMLPPAQRIWDWLQWRWNNSIVQFNGEQQAGLWLQAWQGGKAMMAWSEKANGRPVGLLMLGSVLMFLLWRRRGRNEAKYWRGRALTHLREAMPHHRDLLNPGQDAALWAWWRMRRPDAWQEIQALYLRQRYGPAPGGALDKRLRHVLRNTAPGRPAPQGSDWA